MTVLYDYFKINFLSYKISELTSTGEQFVHKKKVFSPFAHSLM